MKLAGKLAGCTTVASTLIPATMLLALLGAGHRTTLGKMSTKFIFRKVLVGYDGSRGAKAALERAAAMAGEHDIAVTALWAARPLPRYSDLLGEVKAKGSRRRILQRLPQRCSAWQSGTGLTSAAKQAAAIRPKPFCASPTKTVTT